VEWITGKCWYYSKDLIFVERDYMDNFVEKECLECMSLGIHTPLEEPKSHPRLCWMHEQVLRQMNRQFHCVKDYAAETG
jgi:hypothetical protein